ncbi:hypothetical protein Tco_0418711 [Tanacetum coccineum]
MSNTNTNLQTQTSNALHNAIMEAGGKGCPPMLAPGNYIQWKSRIKRYIDTKPNNEHIHYCLQNPPYKFKWTEKTVPVAEAEAVQIILTGIDNDIYSRVDACPNSCEMWKAIERLKQAKSINVQDLETNLYWEFRKFTSQDGESLKSYYSRFYKIMNELVRNKCDVTNHQVNVQFLLQLQLKWQSFVTLVKHSQELKTVSYYKLYDILKQHQNEVNEIRAERIAPATRNRGKTIVNFPPPTYDQEPTMVAKDDKMSNEKEIDKIMALIFLSFKKIYKPTNNNLRTSSNTSRANQDNTPRINRGTGYDNHEAVNVVGVGECSKGMSETEMGKGCIISQREDAIVTLSVHGKRFKREHHEQPESVNDAYLEEQGDTNFTIDSLDMSYDRELVDQDDDDLPKELICLLL